MELGGLLDTGSDVHRVADRRVVAEVAEQDCHLPALSSGEGVAQLLHPCGHLRREVPAESLALALLPGDAANEMDRAPGVIRADCCDAANDAHYPVHERPICMREREQPHLQRGADSRD